MRLVLASAWYPVGVGAYLLRAARRIQKTNPDLQVVTVGPTSGAQCWAPEFQFPEHAIRPDFVPTDSRPDCGSLVYQVEQAVAEGRIGPPDLWIDIDGGWFTNGVMKYWPHAIVATDPHIPEQGGTWTYERQREVADFFFCMQKPYCHYGAAVEDEARGEHEVTREGIPGSHEKTTRQDYFLPYAYDPEVFHPYPDQAMDADVTVLGVPYPKRTLVAQELNRRGFRVLAGMGSVYEKYARDLCRAPVCFIWSLKDDVPCRVFEAAACGVDLVVNASIAEEIRAILPGLHFSTFKDAGDEDNAVHEAADATSCVIVPLNWITETEENSIEEIRSEITHRNLSAVAGHTWDARLRSIVKTCTGVEL